MNNNTASQNTHIDVGNLKDDSKYDCSDDEKNKTNNEEEKEEDKRVKHITIDDLPDLTLENIRLTLCDMYSRIGYPTVYDKVHKKLRKEYKTSYDSSRLPTAIVEAVNYALDWAKELRKVAVDNYNSEDEPPIDSDDDNYDDGFTSIPGPDIPDEFGEIVYNKKGIIAFLLHTLTIAPIDMGFRAKYLGLATPVPCFCPFCKVIEQSATFYNDTSLFDFLMHKNCGGRKIWKL